MAGDTCSCSGKKCPSCGHWVGPAHTERPFECETCGEFFPEIGRGR